jgi:hypothetical protein
MCIFCGGACGGIGDMLLPTLATGAGLVMFKIKASKESRKTSDNNQNLEVESTVTKYSKIKSTVKNLPESNKRLNSK